MALLSQRASLSRARAGESGHGTHFRRSAKVASHALTFLSKLCWSWPRFRRRESSVSRKTPKLAGVARSCNGGSAA
jgi:hypothetical protein